MLVLLDNFLQGLDRICFDEVNSRWIPLLFCVSVGFFR